MAHSGSSRFLLLLLLFCCCWDGRCARPAWDLEKNPVVPPCPSGAFDLDSIYRKNREQRYQELLWTLVLQGWDFRPLISKIPVQEFAEPCLRDSLPFPVPPQGSLWKSCLCFSGSFPALGSLWAGGSGLAVKSVQASKPRVLGICMCLLLLLFLLEKSYSIWGSDSDWGLKWGQC